MEAENKTMDKMFEEQANGKEKNSKFNLYDEVDLANNIDYAKQVKAESEEKLKKIKKVWIIAIIGSFLGTMVLANDTALVIAFFIACICYHQVGGFKIAFKWSWNLAKFGWFVIPYFPVDLVVAFTAFFFGLYGLFFMPIFVILHVKKQASIDLETADRFLRSCQQVQEAHQE